SPVQSVSKSASTSRTLSQHASRPPISPPSLHDALPISNAHEIARAVFRKEGGDFGGHGTSDFVRLAHEVTCAMTAEVTALLPKDRPRYLMGVGDRKSVV